VSAATTNRDAGQTRDIARAQIEALFAGSWTLAAVGRFHTAHKLLLMAHSPQRYRDLGRLVAEMRALPRDEFAIRYAAQFTTALCSPATRRGHVNALQHAAGYFKHRLDRAAKAGLAAAIDDYRRGRVPLAVPMTLLRTYVREHAVSYLAEQAYLTSRSG
jgi:uncharacterized protein YbgA (DUF1722 family)